MSRDSLHDADRSRRLTKPEHSPSFIAPDFFLPFFNWVKKTNKKKHIQAFINSVMLRLEKHADLMNSYTAQLHLDLKAMSALEPSTDPLEETQDPAFTLNSRYFKKLTGCDFALLSNRLKDIKEFFTVLDHLILEIKHSVEPSSQSHGEIYLWVDEVVKQLRPYYVYRHNKDSGTLRLLTDDRLSDLIQESLVTTCARINRFLNIILYCIVHEEMHTIPLSPKYDGAVSRTTSETATSGVKIAPVRHDSDSSGSRTNSDSKSKEKSYQNIKKELLQSHLKEVICNRVAVAFREYAVPKDTFRSLLYKKYQKLGTGWKILAAVFTTIGVGAALASILWPLLIVEIPLIGISLSILVLGGVGLALVTLVGHLIHILRQRIDKQRPSIPPKWAGQAKKKIEVKDLPVGPNLNKGNTPQISPLPKHVTSKGIDIKQHSGSATEFRVDAPLTLSDSSMDSKDSKGSKDSRGSSSTGPIRIYVSQTASTESPSPVSPLIPGSPGSSGGSPVKVHMSAGYVGRVPVSPLGNVAVRKLTSPGGQVRHLMSPGSQSRGRMSPVSQSRQIVSPGSQNRNAMSPGSHARVPVSPMRPSNSPDSSNQSTPLPSPTSLIPGQPWRREDAWRREDLRPRAKTTMPSRPGSNPTAFRYASEGRGRLISPDGEDDTVLSHAPMDFYPPTDPYSVLSYN